MTYYINSLSFFNYKSAYYKDNPVYFIDSNTISLSFLNILSTYSNKFPFNFTENNIKSLSNFNESSI